MDAKTLMDLGNSYAVILIPIITGLMIALKNIIPESRRKQFTPLLSVVTGIAASLLVIGFTREAGITGAIMGLSASGLWSTATSPFKKKSV